MKRFHSIFNIRETLKKSKYNSCEYQKCQTFYKINFILIQEIIKHSFKKKGKILGRKENNTKAFKEVF